MAKNKKKQKLICEVCGTDIEERSGSFLKCPYCIKATHLQCALKLKLIASNMFYYCETHKEHARNFLPTAQTVTNEETVETGGSNAASQLSQLSELFESHVSIQDTRRNSTAESISRTGNDRSHQDPVQTGVPPLVSESRENIISHPSSPFPRTSNMRNSQNRPAIPPKPCKKCNVQDNEAEFKCRVCSATYHNACVTQNERLNDVGGSWACSDCFLGYRKFYIQFHQQESSIDAVPDERKSPSHEKLSESAEWKSLFEFLMAEQKKDKNELMERIDAKFQDLVKKIPPIAQSTPSTSNACNNPPQRIEQQQQSAPTQNPLANLTERDIQAIVEESMRRSRELHNPLPVAPENPQPQTSQEEQNEIRQGILSSNEMQRRLLENQLMESKKNAYRKLPTVKQSNYQWKVFYNAFLETEKLFTEQENVTRIEEAIQCDEIRDLGGSNLFTLATYEDALKAIDKRVGKPEKLLLKEKQSLINYGKMSNSDRKKIIKFIQEVDKYANLVEKIGSYTNKADGGLINRLSRMLPDFFLNGWAKEYNKIQEETGEVLLNDLSCWLNKQVENLDRVQLFDDGDPYNDQRGQKSNNKKEKAFPKSQKKENFLIHQEDKKGKESFSYPKRENKEESFSYPKREKKVPDSPANYCWWHKRTGHSSLTCYSLLSKSGQEVTRLAKDQNICPICSRKSHSPCPFKDKSLNCLIPNCKYKHAMIFCFKRRKQSLVDLGEKSANNNDNGEQSHNAQHNHGNARASSFNNASENVASMMINALGSQINSESDTESSNMMIEKPESNSESHVQHAVREKGKAQEIAKLSIVCVNLHNEGKIVKCALLLDSGSTMSMIDAKYAEILGLSGPKAPIQISWSGGQSREDKESCIVKVKAQGIQENAKSYEIHFRTITNLNMPPQKFDAKALKAQFSHLKNLPLLSYSQVIGVIGTDQHWFFQQQKWLQAKNRTDSKEAPVAVLTPLGYSVIGGSRTLPKIHKCLKANKESSCFHSEFVLTNDEKEELQAMQERVMGLEYLLPYENDRKIAEEVQALKCLHEKVRKVPGENYFEAPLLFRDPNPQLPTQESYKIALKRLRILIKHATNIGKLNEIIEEVNNLTDKNYARKLTQKEIENPPRNAFYIPIFLSAQKGKRLRLIWDAAAKVAEKSLNDYLLAGPNLYVNLLSLIMKSREGKYLVKADISEMFHQVQINSKDRASLRFLFPDKISGKLDHYEMNVMIFGAVCSPTTSQFIKNLIADEAEKEFPEAATIIKNKTYVDDVVTSSNNIESLKQRILEVRNILKSGGFNLVKLRGNNPEILKKVKENLSEEDFNNPKLFSKEHEEKLLGYLFNFITDEIGLADITGKFSKEFLEGTKVPTKRDVLKLLMSFFDPLGLFSFFTSKLKIIYHWICKEKIDWKEKIPEKLIPFWQKVLKWIPEILRIKVQRPYSQHIDKAARKQLLIFGDAGKDMLCTVAYIRLLDAKGQQLDHRLVASKTYTVPLKQRRSIPELELDVAVKSVEFKKLIEKSHDIKFDETFFATDSSCVYTWITKGVHKGTLYVQRRLGKIHASSSKEEWMWLRSELQPADYGTKFESMPEMSLVNEWFEPKLFSLPEENWFRQSPPISESQGELHTNIEVDSLPANQVAERWANRYSSFYKMRNSLKLLKDRRYSWIISAFKKKLNACTDDKVMEKINHKINSFEKCFKEEKDEKLRKAELDLIKIAQKEVYGKEIKSLKKQKCLQKQSKLFKFSPFIDKEEVLRVTTRLPPSGNFHYDKLCPIVLPNKHKLTKSIILHYHKLNKHQLHKSVIIDLTQRFFIPSIASTVKKTIKELCMKCKRENAKPDRPMMGDLPGYRLATEDPPFSYTIIDVCGPFSIRVHRKTEKRWLLVMSCLTTRAVHIEVLYSMDSQSLLMALDNLTNIRGAPKRIISDNGLNFVGGNNILQALQKRWDEKLAKKGLIAHKIEWEFSPAKAASMNGSVERMVALVKSVLKKMHDTLDRKLIIPSDEVFHCLTKEIIGILNNRPLTMMPINGTDNTFLTPNFFLTQRQNCKVTPKSPNSVCQLKRWEEVKDFMGILWDHFNKAYVHELLFRQKWFEPKRKLEEGDIIVTADPTITNLWRLGVITKVIEGSKDQVRKVSIKLGKRNGMNVKELKTKKAIMAQYVKETYSEITRPASEVAFINLSIY